MKHDLKDLEAFIYVAQLKSFSRAAEALNTAKSNITSRIYDLEKIAKMPLLARTTREVNLTTEGQEFLEYCKSIMAEIDNLDEFLNKKKGINGVLKIVLPPYFSRYHIVPYLKEFLALYPQLKLDIVLDEDEVNIIKEGYDLQVRIQILEEENLKAEKIMNNQKIICASRDYIKKNGRPKNPQDLLNHNCIIFGENKIWKFRCKKTKKITELRKMDGNIRCNNGEIIKELVLNGVGLTVKSARDVEDEIKSGEIEVLMPDYEVINDTSFYVVYPAKKYKSAKIKAFIEFFSKKLA